MKKKFLIMLIFVFQLVLQTVVLAEHYEISGTSTTANQTFQNYDETENGGVFYVDTDGKLIISSATFINNKTTKNGGAIYNRGGVNGELNITGGVIFNSNTAEFGGAIYNEENSEIKISGEKVEFSSNTVNGNGAAIVNNNASSMTICGNNIIFNFNTSKGIGGTILNGNNSLIEIKGENIIFNSNISSPATEESFGYGGAILNTNSSTMMTGNNITFSSNVAYGYGGAIYNDLLSLMEINSEGVINFFFNRATSSGGGIYNTNNSTTTIRGQDIIFSCNSSSSGGAILNNSSMTMHGDNIIFESNSATAFDGGAISTFFYDSYSRNPTTTIIGKNIEFNKNTANYGSGGAIYNYEYSTVIITGGKIEFSYNTAGEYGGAVYNDDNSTMTIIGEDILFSNNKAEKKIDDFSGLYLGAGGAIYNGNSILNLVSSGNMEFTENKARGVSNAIHDEGGTINLYAGENAKIVFNDRITSENSSSILNINNSNESLIQNAIGKIVLNEDMSGYIGQVNLYKGTVQIGQYGTWFGGNTYVDDATIDIANSIIHEHTFNNLKINRVLNLAIDADLENKQMDTITANEDSDIQGKVHVKAINILADATEDRTEILFTSSTVLKDKITTIKTASSGLYKYDINYNDGYLTFIKAGDDQIRTQSQVATAVGGAITQTAVLNQAFTSIDSAIQDRYINYYESSKHKNIKKSNLYASTTNLLYEEPNKIEKGLWIRPYAIQDTIDINNMSVDNTAMGTLAGLDLSVGENSLLSFYIGYAGSTQKYENIKINQTGYVVGATGMIVKDDYYLSLTANINFNKAESENDYGADKFDMNMYALGAKAGYNIYLGERWIIEPNITLMYGNINTAGYETKQGVEVASQSTNNMLIEPQIKVKLDLTDGWTPYALVGYVFNSGSKTKLVANNIAFDDMQITGYAEYGVGVNKIFEDSFWSCFLQVVGRGGDKNGFEGNIGIKYSL